MRLRGLREDGGGLAGWRVWVRATGAVCAQIKTQVMAGKLPSHVTH